MLLIDSPAIALVRPASPACCSRSPCLDGPLTAAGSVQSPEQFIGFKVGADRKLVRWDQIVEYMRLAADESDRVRLRDLGQTTAAIRSSSLEISSPETLKNLDRVQAARAQAVFSGRRAHAARARRHLPAGQSRRPRDRAASTRNEIGATQMALELVHRLATDDSPAVKKILDNVILLLVPSANPDGQILVTDWFNQQPSARRTKAARCRDPYHPYVGPRQQPRHVHASRRRRASTWRELAWHDWFPTIWLDQHQMGTSGPRMFVMPAADPINPNVHPLIYRWNAILGQSQAAALEAAGKDGIIYNSTYTNFWQGALAWSGWWHNQIGLLTEVASVRVASPIDQLARDRADGSCRRRAGTVAPIGQTPLAAAADRHHAAHRIPASLARRPLDAPRHRRLRARSRRWRCSRRRRIAGKRSCGRSTK